MEITYLGQSSFRIKTKSGSLVTDPFDPKMVGMKFSKVEANIVTVSHHHPDHDKVDEVGGNFKEIDGPGEYEIMGISVIGLSSFHDNKKGAERGKNTIYVIEAEGLRIAHLGDLGHTLSESTLDAMGDIDILLIPVGGFYTINPNEAAQVAGQIEPSIIVPMHYKLKDLTPELSANLSPVEDFVKEVGIVSETLPKLSISKEEIQEEVQKLYILERK